jgi:hypothetical protein
MPTVWFYGRWLGASHKLKAAGNPVPVDFFNDALNYSPHPRFAARRASQTASPANSEGPDLRLVAATRLWRDCLFGTMLQQRSVEKGASENKPSL